MQKITRDSPLESPGMFLAPEEQVSSVVFDGVDATKLSKYKRMTFDWNIVLTEIFKEIEEMETFSTRFSIEGKCEDSARVLIVVQRSKFPKERWREFSQTARDHSLRLSFAKRSELLGKLKFGRHFSYVTSELDFIDQHEKWIQLKSKIESLTNGAAKIKPENYRNTKNNLAQNV